MNTGPPRTDFIHLCCDHCYDTLSLKSVENAKRYNPETAVEYVIDNQYPVPTPDFFPLSAYSGWWVCKRRRHRDGPKWSGVSHY